jgi:hypothetical protein
MRVKHLAAKNKMTKGKANSATSWVPSTLKQKELDKAKADGLVSNKDSIIFAITELIPKPPSGYRVMFLAFLLRGLSLPAHEFLRGLLYVYGVQLHQAHTKFYPPHCLFCDPLRVIPGYRTPFSALEVHLLAPP